MSPHTSAPGREPFDPARVTVADAKAYLRDRWLKGAACPCCTQRVQVYRRTITVGMALALLAFLRADARRRQTEPDFDGFLHAEETFKNTVLLPRSARGDFTKLRYWGLIEGAEGEREDGSRRNGHWRLTERGRAFARREIAVPKYVYLYNDAQYTPEAIGADPDQGEVTIHDALGRRFSYDEVVRGLAPTESRSAENPSMGRAA